MTKFDKNQFEYHEGYLTYHGPYETAEYYEDGPNVHPTRVGTQKHLFIARFKYSTSPFTKAKVMKKIMELFSVEQYAQLMKEGGTPLGILKDADPQWHDKVLYSKYAKGELLDKILNS